MNICIYVYLYTRAGPHIPCADRQSRLYWTWLSLARCNLCLPHSFLFLIPIRFCLWLFPLPNPTSKQLARIRNELVPNSAGLEVAWIRIQLDSHSLGWIRIQLDSSSLGFELRWIRIQLDSSSLGSLPNPTSKRLALIRNQLVSNSTGFEFAWMDSNSAGLEFAWMDSNSAGLELAWIRIQL